MQIGPHFDHHAPGGHVHMERVCEISRHCRASQCRDYDERGGNHQSPRSHATIDEPPGQTTGQIAVKPRVHRSTGVGDVAPTVGGVLVATGDGELLMNIGALATIAVLNPANLAILCVDNGHYGETGSISSGSLPAPASFSQPDRRRRRHRLRHCRVGDDLPRRRLADAGLPDRHPRRVRLFRRGRDLLRLLPGAQGGAPRPGRRSALRVMPLRHHRNLAARTDQGCPFGHRVRNKARVC